MRPRNAPPHVEPELCELSDLEPRYCAHCREHRLDPALEAGLDDAAPREDRADRWAAGAPVKPYAARYHGRCPVCRLAIAPGDMLVDDAHAGECADAAR